MALPPPQAAKTEQIAAAIARSKWLERVIGTFPRLGGASLTGLIGLTARRDYYKGIFANTPRRNYDADLTYGSQCRARSKAQGSR